MKIYLFNPETGVYLGEDFADDLSMCQSEADLPHATSNAPPPFRREEMPVFVVAENKWEIRPVPAAVTRDDGDRQANLMPQRQRFRQAPRQEDEQL